MQICEPGFPKYQKSKNILRHSIDHFLNAENVSFVILSFSTNGATNKLKLFLNKLCVLFFSQLLLIILKKPTKRKLISILTECYLQSNTLNN